jgi:selenocysteine lyase/cysteine desulfurase
MPPWQGGGHMIKDVRFEKTIYQNAPEKFEAGTPDIAGVVGLGAAIDYLFKVGIPGIAAYEHALLEYATQALATIPGLRPSARREQGERAVLRHSRRAERKHRAASGQKRHRRPRRTSLRTAGHPAFRFGKQRAPVARVLQHARGSGRAGAGVAHFEAQLIAC